MGDITVLNQLISTVGFPIVACGAMFWQNYKSEERHKKETESFVESINKNTAALEKLILKIEMEESE